MIREYKRVIGVHRGPLDDAMDGGGGGTIVHMEKYCAKELTTSNLVHIADLL